MSLALFAIAEAERRAREAAAELRQLEQDVGRSASADGRAWLARTKALEYVHVAALRALRTGDMAELAEACAVAEGLGAPACRDGDHQLVAA